jgi:hypothetical protein
VGVQLPRHYPRCANTPLPSPSLGRYHDTTAESTTFDAVVRVLIHQIPLLPLLSRPRVSLRPRVPLSVPPWWLWA